MTAEEKIYLMRLEFRELVESWADKYGFRLSKISTYTASDQDELKGEFEVTSDVRQRAVSE